MPRRRPGRRFSSPINSRPQDEEPTVGLRHRNDFIVYVLSADGSPRRASIEPHSCTITGEVGARVALIRSIWFHWDDTGHQIRIFDNTAPHVLEETTPLFSGMISAVGLQERGELTVAATEVSIQEEAWRALRQGQRVPADLLFGTRPGNAPSEGTTGGGGSGRGVLVSTAHHWLEGTIHRFPEQEGDPIVLPPPPAPSPPDQATTLTIQAQGAGVSIQGQQGGSVGTPFFHLAHERPATPTPESAPPCQCSMCIDARMQAERSMRSLMAPGERALHEPIPGELQSLMEGGMPPGRLTELHGRAFPEPGLFLNPRHEPRVPLMGTSVPIMGALPASLMPSLEGLGMMGTSAEVMVQTVTDVLSHINTLKFELDETLDKMETKVRQKLRTRLERVLDDEPTEFVGDDFDDDGQPF